MGKALKGFQEASRDFENEFKREAQQIEQAVKTPAPVKAEPVATANSDSSTASPSQEG
jgi:sec-independent protein translocase protein TatA